MIKLKHFWSLMIVLFTIYQVHSQELSLITPKNNLVTSNNHPLLKWNYKDGAIQYQVRISLDSTFLTGSQQYISSSEEFQFTNPLASGRWFWQIETSIGGNTYFSNIGVFTIFTPQDFAGIKLWLDGDSVGVSNGRVYKWFDKSGNNNDCDMSAESLKPFFNDEDSNIYHPVIEFNGSQYLQGNTISSINDASLNAFIISNGYETGGILQGLFSIGNWLQKMGIYRRQYTQRLTYTNGNNITDIPNSAPNDGYDFNLYEVDKKIDTTVNLYLNNMLGSTSSNGTAVGSFANGDYRIGYSNYQKLKGSIAEIIIYTGGLTDENRELIASYLMDKYAPPLNLGQDLKIDYGFCDTIVGSNINDYESYLWSTGDTTKMIQVNQSGLYSLQVVDLFGRISIDTIFIAYLDSIPNLIDKMVCYNNTYSIEAFVPSGNYTFNEWSDGNSNPIRLLNQNEIISYSVNDTLGCTGLSNEAIVNIDSSLEYITLGEDTSLCVGNSIQLEQSSSTITDYLWNTGIILENQVVDTSGIYILEVVNENGCENSDTIEVIIIGDAPELSYSIPTEICQGSEFSFSQSSTVPPGNNISDVIWNFGELDSIFVSSGIESYVDSGVYNGFLEVSTLEGCSSKENFSITVYPKPIISFETENYCPYEAISFSASNDFDVPLFFYNWEFGQNSSSSSDVSPNYTYGISGNYDVQLIVIDTNNCIDTVNQNVYIQPAPVADIAIVNPCELSALEITDNSSISDTFSIVTYSWDYGDNTTAVNPTEEKFYEEYGEYTVQMVLTANNGCVDSIEQNITVHPNPILNHEIGPACMNTWTSLSDLSEIPLGSLSETNWLINLQYSDNAENTAFKFPTEGIQLVNLQSTSDQGCIVDTTFEIDVQAEISAEFMTNPVDLTSGIPIQFINESIGSDSSFWNFGDGNGFQYNQNEINDITYDNSLNGSSIEVSLIITNNLGCRDTSNYLYEIKEAFFDLALQTLFVQDIDGYLTVGVELKNLGSVVVDNASLYLKSAENVSILENWTGSISQNESEIYIFNAHPPSYTSSQDETERSVCVEGIGLNSLGYTDIDISNNRVCKNIEGTGLILLPIYPNPTKEDIIISILLTEASPLRIELVDQSGRLIFNQYYAEKLEMGIHNIQLPFSRLQKGIYHVRVSDESNTLLEKIVRY